MPDRYFQHDATVTVDAETVFRVLIGDTDNSFWLDDSLGDTVSYIGVGVPIQTGDAFSEFDDLSNSPVSRVGWVPYGYRSQTLGVSVGDEKHAGPVILDVTCAVRINHVDGRATVFSLDDQRGQSWAATLGELSRTRADTGTDSATRAPTGLARSAVWRDQPAEYAIAIAVCLDRISDGDAYQLCLTTSVDVAGKVDDLETYLRLRREAPTHYGGLIRTGGVSLLSASPELFLSVVDGVASTKPIKGTRRRSADPVEDDRLIRELVDSDKERAENLMIVDLCRNDLSTVCVVGSVNVPALHVVETYSTVHQLVSTVTGRIQPELSAGDVARALFPAGSMTGAPKRAAVEILSRIETGERGIYSGVFGFSGSGGMTLAMTIRSIVIDDDGATVGVGGGITSGSQPHEEIREVGIKADALLRVLDASPNLFLATE